MLLTVVNNGDKNDGAINHLLDILSSTSKNGALMTSIPNECNRYKIIHEFRICSTLDVMSLPHRGRLSFLSLISRFGHRDKTVALRQPSLNLNYRNPPPRPTTFILHKCWFPLQPDNLLSRCCFFYLFIYRL